jgi:phospholipase C
MSWNWDPWRSVSEGVTRPGGHVTAVPWGDSFALFISDPGGGIYAIKAVLGFGWELVPGRSSTPGAHVTAVASGDRFTLFMADVNGEVFTTSGVPYQGWQPWTSVSEGGTKPGAPVTAVPWGDSFALFLADPNGGIYAIKVVPGFGWELVPGRSSTPGAHVTAVASGDRFTLFMADVNGEVFTTSGIPYQGWQPWTSVSEGGTKPGAPVTAVPWGNSFALFLADPSGGIYAIKAVPGFGWVSVSEGSSTPGAPVAAVPWGDRFALFIADPNGGVYTAAGDPLAGFGGWSSVSEGRTAPGAPITGVSWGATGFALFAADPNGGIYSTSWNPNKTKTISLDFLQRKFDVFFNHRAFPPFQIRLDSKEHKWAQSELSLDQLDPVNPNGGNYVAWKEMSLPADELTVSEGVNRRIYFQELKSDGIKVNVVPGQPVGVEAVIHFETGGPLEIKVEGRVAEDVDITEFKITLKLEFDLYPGTDPTLTGKVDLVGFLDEIDQAMKAAKVEIDAIGPPPRLKVTVQFRGETIKKFGTVSDDPRGQIQSELLKRFINSDAKAHLDVSGQPDVSSLLETKFNSAIKGMLTNSQPADSSNLFTRASLNKAVTRWLLGGDFDIVGISSNDQSLTINYTVPDGQLPPFPENPQPPLPPLDPAEPLAQIEHIVVLMMENRSFDHMLGYLSKEGGRTDIDGLKGGESVQYQGKNYPSFHLPGTQFVHSPCHEHNCVDAQINDGKCDGFVASYVGEYPDADPGEIMGYYDGSQVKTYDGLAKEFLVCQRWFPAHPGPTFVNRFYLLTGRPNRDPSGSFEVDNFSGDNFRPVPTNTIFDHLTDHGVSWHFYEQRYCTLRLYSRYTFDDTFIIDANDDTKGFFASAAAGTLPSVSFIDPNFIDEPDGQDNDDGAPSDVLAGQHFVGSVVKALIEGPKWEKTLLVITYDEHGGFYDHVNPLDPAYRATAVPVSGRWSLPDYNGDYYGVRVPALVVSPWVDRGAVSNIVFDHTSIAKTIIKRFMRANPPDMGERVAAANDLSMILRLTPRPERPIITIPTPPARPALAQMVTSSSDGRDFKDVMRELRARYPIPRPVPVTVP